MTSILGRPRRAAGAVRARWRSLSRTRRSLLAVLVALGVLVLPVGSAALALRLQYAGDPADEARTRGRDAVWLGHAWVDGRKGEEDVTALAQRLAGTGIRDLY